MVLHKAYTHDHFYNLTFHRMNWFKKYYNDATSKGAVISILLFCIAFILAGGAWWITVLILAGYALLFYVMRKNP